MYFPGELCQVSLDAVTYFTSFIARTYSCYMLNFKGMLTLQLS